MLNHGQIPAVLTTRLNISKIGVISDTHIPTRAAHLPAGVHTHFKNTDLIIHCGDIVQNDVLTELRTIAPLYSVKGNMDGHDIHEPEQHVLIINNTFTLCISHGTGSPNGLYSRLYKKFISFNPYMILYGHTHLPDTGSYNGVFFFNPGSCTAGHVQNTLGKLVIKDNYIEQKIITL